MLVFPDGLHILYPEEQERVSPVLGARERQPSWPEGPPESKPP